jgi:hypothetical protein
MNEKQNPKINIGNVSGNVVISQNQGGGITSHSSSTVKDNPRKKTFFRNKYVLMIGFIASILAILGYFGFQPSKPSNADLHNDYKIPKDNNILVVDTLQQQDTVLNKDTIIKKKSVMKRKENKSEKEKPISIGDVSGDVVISQNQTGGITAHSVSVNEVESPEWAIGKSEKISESEWRTVLSAKGCK